MAEQKTDVLDYLNSFSTYQNKIVNEFNNPIHQNVFFNNLSVLQENSDLITFNVEKWYMRPEVFCNDFYEASYLYQIVLLSNNIKSFFDFIPDNFIDRIIIAPYQSQIQKILAMTVN